MSTQQVFRDKSVRMTEETMASLKLLGWDFYMVGPNEWCWMRFAANGRAIAIQCDALWANDLQMIHELQQRKLTLEKV